MARRPNPLVGDKKGRDNSGLVEQMPQIIQYNRMGPFHIYREADRSGIYLLRPSVVQILRWMHGSPVGRAALPLGLQEKMPVGQPPEPLQFALPDQL